MYSLIKPAIISIAFIIHVTNIIASQVEDSRLLPVHLNFVRLVRLYPSGGTYLGFSFLLHNPLPSTTTSSSREKSRIVDLGPKWWVKKPPTPAAAASMSGDKGDSSSGFHPPACGNEFLLQLPARDPLLRCVLSRL